MSALSRAQAEALLAPVRGGRALYDELRPAYVSLDPLVALLRRRRFSGVILGAGASGDGAVWLEEGRLSGGWLFSSGSGDAAIPPDPLEVLRILWGDADARVAVHPARPPTLPQAPAVSVPDGQAPASEHAPLPDPASAPRAAGQLPPTRRVAARKGVPVGPPAVTQSDASIDPALAGVPWSRLLPETLARVRRHRGTPLAQRLEDAVNVTLGSNVTVAGRDVMGQIDPARAAAALRAVAAGLGEVAGAAFAERLLWTVGRDFACEDALKRLLTSPRRGGEDG
ncbi:MAG: hypothetical protein ACRDF5_08845 [bacterium]